MKNVLRIIGILLLAVIFLVTAVSVISSLLPVIPGNYTEKTDTGGDIEKKYLSMGKHKVSSVSVRREDSLKKILIFYPSDLKDSDKAWPAVIYSNGTGQKGSQYRNLYRHLASWGFIVMANDDSESYSGLPAEKMLTYLLEENENENSIFRQKIDTASIGTYGHSQGGAAVFNTITAQEHSSMYKTAVSLSPTHEELADALHWHYDLSQVSVPVLLIAGTSGEFETETVIPFEKMTAMYEKLNVPKAMARKTGAAHADTASTADGYVTAWFMWQLQGDQEAGKAFTGEDPELLKNPLYQDQRIDYPVRH